MPWVTVPVAQVPPNAGAVYGAPTNGDATYLAMSPVNEDRPAVLFNGAVVPSAAVGSALTCTMGNWLGAPTGYAYQWHSGVTVVGTNSNTYTLVAGDVGNNVSCTVTATNATGSTVGPPSNLVACHA
jgi:hypothetical protein